MSRWSAIAIDGEVLARPIGRRAPLPLPEGWHLTPGMVDLQVNGFGGVEVGSDPGAIERVAALLPSEGVTAFCPTLVTRSGRGYDAAARALEEARDRPGSARILAPHLEGPFLAPTRVGAHRAEDLREPSREAVD
ncbi:MAG: N-acetylglucosamine-6-phosphate deacetylase, partial [Miltoncostaeaceae bacterium]